MMTKVIELPSKGWFYPEGHPLSSGEVELKQMTAKEEDILADVNLIRRGIVFDKLLEALVVEPDREKKQQILDDMLTGDRGAILIATRILAYGPEYKFYITDPDTGEKELVTVDLTELEPKPVPFERYPKGTTEFEFHTPVTDKDIKLRLLTMKDLREIDTTVKRMTKLGQPAPVWTTRLMKHVVEVDGDRSTKAIAEFVNNLPSRDSLAIRKFLQEITPDIDLTFTYTTKMGEEVQLSIELDANFFWPDS